MLTEISDLSFVVFPFLQLDFEGLTGRINFDEDGYRADYKLDVYTVSLDKGPTKVWSNVTMNILREYP